MSGGMSKAHTQQQCRQQQQAHDFDLAQHRRCNGGYALNHEVVHHIIGQRVNTPQSQQQLK